jgi:hypothetical protein
MRMDVIRQNNIRCTRKDLSIDDEKDTEINSIYQSKVWKEEILDKNFFTAQPRNVVLGLSSDGFVPAKRSKHSIWPITCVFINLPEQIRAKPQNIGLIAVIDGPRKPSNYQIYLKHVVDELNQLYHEGIEITDSASNGMKFNVKAKLLFTVADLQGK